LKILIFDFSVGDHNHLSALIANRKMKPPPWVGRRRGRVPILCDLFNRPTFGTEPFPLNRCPQWTVFGAFAGAAEPGASLPPAIATRRLRIEGTATYSQELSTIKIGHCEIR
jgi:hypothetical protein